jgi:hypothetical protein
MDETEEQDVEVKEVEEPLPDLEPAPAPAPAATDASATPASATLASAASTEKEPTEFSKSISENLSKISFADDDTLVDTTGVTSVINAPKDEKNLEEIEKARALAEIKEEDDDEDERLTIGDNIKLDVFDINDLSRPATVDLKPPVLDFEVLT